MWLFINYHILLVHPIFFDTVFYAIVNGYMFFVGKRSMASARVSKEGINLVNSYFKMFYVFLTKNISIIFPPKLSIRSNVV